MLGEPQPCFVRADGNPGTWHVCTCYMYGSVFTYMCVCMDACIQLANVLSLLLARGASTTGHRAAHTVHVCTRPYLHAHLVHPLVRTCIVCVVQVSTTARLSWRACPWPASGSLCSHCRARRERASTSQCKQAGASQSTRKCGCAVAAHARAG